MNKQELMEMLKEIPDDCAEILLVDKQEDPEDCSVWQLIKLIKGDAGEYYIEIEDY